MSRTSQLTRILQRCTFGQGKEECGCPFRSSDGGTKNSQFSQELPHRALQPISIFFTNQTTEKMLLRHCCQNGHWHLGQVEHQKAFIAPEETGSASFGQLNAAGSAKYLISIAFISSGPPHLKQSCALSAISWKMHSFRTHMRSKILSDASRLKIGHSTFAGEHAKIIKNPSNLQFEKMHKTPKFNLSCPALGPR